MNPLPTKSLQKKALTDLKFVIVSGKGGVGRTTVAATLAHVAAAAGKRVLVAESTTTDRLARMFGHSEPLPSKITTLARGIDAVNVTPASSMQEYGVKILRSELVTRAVFENRAVRGLLSAIPGLDGYAILGKVWWHTTETVDGRPRYDLVIFDGPASGHAGLMFRIPQAVLNAMPMGPLARDARSMLELWHDPTRTALVIVTLAEDLPARETAELAAAARGALGLPLGPLVINALPTGALSAPALDAVMARWQADAPKGSQATTYDSLAATLRLAASVRGQRQAADEITQRLKHDLGLPIITLPRIPTAEIGPAIVAELAPHLAAQL
jgi:Mrp family chromosome partitioning ATPase